MEYHDETVETTKLKSTKCSGGPCVWDKPGRSKDGIRHGLGVAPRVVRRLWRIHLQTLTAVLRTAITEFQVLQRPDARGSVMRRYEDVDRPEQVEG
jgi:hypothetical protein